MSNLYINEKNGKRSRAENHICEFCNKKFLRRIRVDKTRGRFCSRACVQNNISKHGNVTLKCGTCDKEFKRNSSKLSGSKSGIYFCSRSCKDKAHSLDSKCPEVWPDNWGSPKSKEKSRRYIRDTPAPACSDCKEQRRYMLTVHHIDGNPKNNPSDGSNWEIVCENCHAKRHLKLVDGKWIYNSRSITPIDILKGII
jgi:hypothetical protein